MSSTKFFLLNAVVVAILVAYFLYSKTQKPKPTALNLKKGGAFTPVKDVDINDEQELNVYFNFNGHMWDAYEIVGVPAGAPMADVEMAFMKCRQRIDEESKEILEMAYDAIQEKQAKNS